MLPGDVNLPEVTFTSDDAVVNQLFNLLCIENDASFSKRFLQAVRQLQNHLYVKLQGQLLCPDCANGILIRKGWRKRHLKTSRGSFRLLVLQANCKTCDESGVRS